MADEKKNWLGPYVPEGSLFREVFQQAKLAFNLMIDPRVHPLAKLVPIAAVAYLFMPFDLIPDFALGFGQLDDIAILMAGLRIFFEFAPPDVVHEHLKRLADVGPWNKPETPTPTPTDTIIDGTFTEKKDE